MEILGVVSAISTAGTPFATAMPALGAVGAEAATIGGLGLGAVGIMGQANAAAQAARGQQAVAQYNAKVAQQTAKAEEQSTLYKQSRVAEQANRQQSDVLAQLGASGAVPTEGAPLQIQGVQKTQSDMDILMLGYQGQIAKMQSQNQSQLDQMQAGIFGQQASNAQTAGIMGAGTSLLSGFGKMAAGNRYGY